MVVPATDSDVKAPNGGWGWAVVFASFILQILTNGITYTFGIIYVELLNYFHSSRSDTAWIGSIQACLLYFTGILGAPLIQRFSWRPVAIAGSIISAVGLVSSSAVNNVYILFITYGFLSGIGNGLMYITSMVTIQHYFDSRRALATGLAVAGSGVGTLVFGSVAQLLIDKYGWRGTVIIEGCIMLIGIFCGAVYKPLPQIQDDNYSNDAESLPEDENKTYQNGIHQGTPKSPSEIPSSEIKNHTTSCCSSCFRKLCTDCKDFLVDIFDFSLLKKPLYVLFCFSVLMFTFGYHVQYTYTPDRAVELGVAGGAASFLVSIMGISNVASRLIFGWISDRSPLLRCWIAASVLLIGGAVACLTFLFTTHVWLIVYSVLFGALSGCFVSLFPVVLVDLLGVGNFEKAFGIMCCVSSIGFLVASPLSGFLVDQTKSLNTPFYMVGGMEIVGGFGLLVIAVRQMTASKEKDYEPLPEQKSRRWSISGTFS